MLPFSRILGGTQAGSYANIREGIIKIPRHSFEGRITWLAVNLMKSLNVWICEHNRGLCVCLCGADLITDDIVLFMRLSSVKLARGLGRCENYLTFS